MRIALILVYYALATCLQFGTSFVAGPTAKSFKSTVSPSSLLSSTSSSYSPEELKARFTKLKPSLPWNVDPVKAGGWYNLELLSGNPKGELVELVVNALKEQGKSQKVQIQFSSTEEENLEALVSLLFAMNKGFDSDLVEGEWSLVFARQGRRSRRIQKLVGKREKAGKSKNVFDTKEMTFKGDVTVLKKGKVMSEVKYTPLTAGYTKTSDGKIVLRRIACEIQRAYFKFWFLPRIRVPLWRQGGFLEFVYLDKDILVLRGNREGLFIHFRPEFLEKQLAD